MTRKDFNAIAERIAAELAASQHMLEIADTPEKKKRWQKEYNIDLEFYRRTRYLLEKTFDNYDDEKFTKKVRETWRSMQINQTTET